MNPARRSALRLTALLAAATVGGPLRAAGASAAAWATNAADADAQALHVLNRLAFGPRPGDLAHLKAVGIDAWIAGQLRPASLPLPPALASQLEALGSTTLSERTLINTYRNAEKKAKRDKSAAAQSERRAFSQKVGFEAGEARLLNALASPRQLQEVMVDFWFNHFNVYAGKGLDKVLVESYEREAIRPHAMGRFRDLLGATARHPAMLFYLDNWLSVAPGYQPRRRLGADAKARLGGLNENYARELMELHTLGVDGGYSQRDVTELARIFTGWTLDAHGRGDGSVFRFDPARHDDGDKTWLGKSVAGRGEAEGDWALDVLAAHPATARHLAAKLAQAFVADQPPAALVERLARRFQDSGGDIPAVLATLFASPEFRDPAARTQKFKTPYRYVISAVRATDLPVRNVRPLLATLYPLGMPLYGCQTPDGYKNTEQAWLNPEAVTRRIEFATALAAGRLPLLRAPGDAAAGGAGVGPKALQREADRDVGGKAGRADADEGTPPIAADALLASLGPALSQRTRDAVAQAEPGLRAALLLGSPDFMRH